MFRRLLRPSLFQSLKRPTRRGPVLTTLSLSFGGGALALNAAASSSNEHQPPLSSLLRGYLVFSLCSLPSLVDASPRIISFLSSVPVLRQVSDAFLKVTFFDQVRPFFFPLTIVLTLFPAVRRRRNSRRMYSPPPLPP